MKKDTIWLVVAIVLLLGVIGGLVWIFGGLGGNDDTGVPEVVDEEITDSGYEEPDESNQEDSIEEIEEEGDGDPNTDDQTEDIDLGDAEIDTSVSYTTANQSVGEDTEELFTLDDLIVTKGEEVLELEYVFSGSAIKEDSSILVSAENKSSLATMVIVVNNVKSDSTGTDYDESITINKDGITRLTKVVSGESNTLKYNLGFTDALEYYLYEPVASEDSLIVKFSIKYPGGEISTDEYGISEFTSEDVTVESNTAENGVRISGYTYSATGGVLRFVFKTSTNTGSPIPSFEGTLSGGILSVTFPSVSADIIYSATGGEVLLPGGVQLDITRSGNQSLYEFVSVGTEYKLFGETSPNQVIVEVKL